MTEPHTSFLSGLVKRAVMALFHLRGWRAVGQAPVVPKGVIIAFPHTSNWDFVSYVGLVTQLSVRARFMAKDSLFRGPLARFMRDMGGVPVSRSAKGNMVEQMVDEFAARDRFLLTIAPEGTRRAVPEWKTGFYQIALKAGVPIVPGFVDDKRKRGGFGEPIMPTGDYAADMALIRAFYAREVPQHAIASSDA